MNYNGPKSSDPRNSAPRSSAAYLGSSPSPSPRSLPAALGARPTLRPPPPNALETYEPPSQLAKRKAALEFPPPQFEAAPSPQPIRGSTPSASVAPAPSYGYNAPSIPRRSSSAFGAPASGVAPTPGMEAPLDRSFSTTSRRPPPWPSSVPPVSFPSSPPSRHDPTVLTRPPRNAARFTFLFAGVIAGVLLGMFVLMPSVRARASTLVQSAEPAAAASTLPAPSASVSVAVTTPAPTAPPVAPILIAPPPDSGIDGDHTLVTFAPSLKTKRVAIDGRFVSTSAPQRLRCGKHVLKVAGTPKRPVDLPCGRSTTLE